MAKATAASHGRLRMGRHGAELFFSIQHWQLWKVGRELAPIKKPGGPGVGLVDPEDCAACADAIGAGANVAVDEADALCHHHSLVCAAATAITIAITTALSAGT